MKIKTQDLTGPALDWAVATAEGMPVRHDPMGFGRTANGGYWIWHKDGTPCERIGKEYSPSTHWDQGGPIIERNQLYVTPWNQVDALGRPYPFKAEDWRAQTYKQGVYQDHEAMYGPAPLVAAMRCYVASRLGDEVDVPEALLQGDKP